MTGSSIRRGGTVLAPANFQMQLPRDLLLVDREKVRGYLLNDDHRHGAAKAKFFQQFGFTIDAWDVLANALRTHGQVHPVVASAATDFGIRHELTEGWMRRTAGVPTSAPSGT